MSGSTAACVNNNNCGSNTSDGANEQEDSEHNANNTQSVDTDAVVFNDPTELPEKHNLPERRKSDIIFNAKVLPSDAETYQLDEFDSHYLLIFNHKNINGFIPRTKTDEDVKKLCETFRKFGFIPEVHNDLKRNEVIDELKKLSDKDFTPYGCVVIAVLTYGLIDGFIYASDNKKYSELDIIEYMQARCNPTLLTKPKVVLVEACPGRICNNYGVTTGQPVKTEKDHDKNEVYTLPNESDMLIFHNSYGSSNDDEPFQFIQRLCDIVDKKPLYDLQDIFREMMGVIAKELNRHNEIPKRDSKNQVPVVMSTLTRKLHLKIDEQSKTTTDYVEGPRESSKTFQLASSSRSPSPQMNYTNLCYCFLYHFDYIKQFLRLFVNDNPDDKFSKILMDIADCIDNDDSTWHSKYVVADYICNHLKNNGEEVFFSIYDKAIQGSVSQNSPVLIQYGPCCCFVDYFYYIRECCRSFVERNPEDVMADNLLGTADAIMNSDCSSWPVIYNQSKSMSHYLWSKRTNEVYYYLHFYKHN